MARGLCERHFRVLPVRPWEKIPAVMDWLRTATDDPTVIARLLAENAGLNLGLACGPQPNGLNIVVIDVDPKNGGVETLADLVREIGPFPDTAIHWTPSGGCHYFFDSPVPIRNSRRLGPGVDVRGEGGQVVLPPSRRRSESGEILPYTAERGMGVWKHTIAAMPEALVAKCLPAPRVIPSWGPVGQAMSNHFRHDEMSPADWVRANLDWHPCLEAEGWQRIGGRGDESLWKRPGKTDEGHSAVLHEPDGPLVNFSSNAPVDLERGLSLFDFLAESRFGGDRAAFARQVRLDMMPREPVEGLLYQVTETIAAVEVEQPTHLVPGGRFLFQGHSEIVARWGSDPEILWASGESLIICGPPATGKTTLAGQVVAGLCGLGGDVLGQPVAECRRVLYLAMDRPSQIVRALSRHFSADDEAKLDERLLAWRGPLPQDLLKDQGQVLKMAQENGCDVVVIDSLKDLCLNLSDDASGSAVNRALQMCLAEGIDVMALHHQRKRGGGENSPMPNTLDAVYGSAWITAGAGSVVLLWGEPGSLSQKLIHLKSPMDPIGPLEVEMDNYAGTTSVGQQWSPLAYLAMKADAGATLAEASQAEHSRTVERGGKLWKATERKLNGLVRAGKARKEERERVGVAGRYFIVPI
jgi:hypothetical protein